MTVTFYALDTLGDVVQTVSEIEAETHEKATFNDVLFINYGFQLEGEKIEFASGFSVKNHIARGTFSVQLYPIDYPSTGTGFETFYNGLPNFFKDKKHIYIHSPDYRIEFLNTPASQCLRINIDDINITSQNGAKYVTLECSEVKSKFDR